MPQGPRIPSINSYYTTIRDPRDLPSSADEWVDAQEQDPELSALASLMQELDRICTVEIPWKEREHADSHLPPRLATPSQRRAARSAARRNREKLLGEMRRQKAARSARQARRSQPPPQQPTQPPPRAGSTMWEFSDRPSRLQRRSVKFPPNTKLFAYASVVGKLNRTTGRTTWFPSNDLFLTTARYSKRLVEDLGPIIAQYTNSTDIDPPEPPAEPEVVDPPIEVIDLSSDEEEEADVPQPTRVEPALPLVLVRNARGDPFRPRPQSQVAILSLPAQITTPPRHSLCAPQLAIPTQTPDPVNPITESGGDEPKRKKARLTDMEDKERERRRAKKQRKRANRREREKAAKVAQTSTSTTANRCDNNKPPIPSLFSVPISPPPVFTHPPRAPPRHPDLDICTGNAQRCICHRCCHWRSSQ
ncbi:hypothetical protein B566_EDAN016826 [Ephemera danica]|nr:hypothetical protein B566_EDAN016826 [Ephemera danica]